MHLIMSVSPVVSLQLELDQLDMLVVKRVRVRGDPDWDHLRNSSGGVEARGVSPSHTFSDTLPGNHESHWRRYVCP